MVNRAESLGNLRNPSYVTVGSRTRSWSSHTNLNNTKDVQHSLKIMNSTNDLPQHFIYTSPTRISSNYDYPDDVKSPKKDKKWTISSLFRRKKKDGAAGSDGASSEDEKKNFLGRRRKKSETKRRKSKPSATFDHIVMPRQLNHDYVNDNTFSEPQRFTSWNLQKSESELLNGNLRTGSADSLAKRSRKELTKARAEARRTTYRKESSSDEDSSHISGSSLKIRSEENLRQRDNSLSKRSRSARTERYLKRHSKDGENPYNYIKLSDESNRSLSRSPLLPISQKTKSSFTSLNSQASSYSGLSTIPPSHTSCSRYRVSNSTENPSYKPPLSMNEYNNSLKKYDDNNFNSQRSISCDANIHRAPSNEFNSNIMHVQLPIVNLRHRNLSLIDANQIRNARQAPPPPPPRDPSRLVTAHYFETGRPNTYYFENRSKSFNQPSLNRNSASIQKNFRSTSEDQLLNDRQIVQNIVRPSSTTPEVKKETFYLTDKNPRSRKPIQINTEYGNVGVRKAADFWKQLDRDKQIQEKNRRSPQMFTCQTHVQNQVFLPSVLQNDVNTDNMKLDCDNVSKTITNTENITTDKSNIIVVDQQNVISDDVEEEKRKSSNLEDALNELEAIFNSLGLGDEDLIDRAEQRERDFVNKQLLEKSNGALSDSNFTYEPFDTVDTPKMHRRFGKKSHTIDRKNDDMASRQMDKRRSHTISDPQSTVISYLNVPPFNSLEDDSVDLDANEVPNIVTDDVVYKKLKHSCNSLKLPDNQPPFGIPLGPITAAANSDYLHATPRNTRHIRKQRKIPDLVTDDLAFRNLRKDFNKEPALPPLTSDDFKNNNNNATEQNYLAKRKAVRSLSANIGSLMSQEVIDRARSKLKTDNNNGQTTIMDTADAMEIARNVLKEKNRRITDTRKAFMSDTDANYTYERNNNDLVKESRKNFLNGLRNHDNNLLGDELLTSKPPHGLSPDRRPSKSPVNHSSESSLDELINTLSEEAKETNERIANELKLLEKQRSSSLKVDELDFERTDTLNRTLNEIDAVSEHAKLCEKLLECVVDSTELISSTKTPVEEVEQIDTESNAEKLVANEVVTRSDSKLSENKSESPSVVSHKSEHDYENLVSDTELNIDEMPIINDVEEDNKCKSPFEERKAELIDSFQKLKHNMEDIDDVLKRTHESKKNSMYDNLSENHGNTGEECVIVPDLALKSEECAFKCNETPTNVPKFSSNYEIELDKSNNTDEDISNNDYLNSLDSLKSPKLVLESASKLTDNQTDLKENNLGKRIGNSLKAIDCMPGTSSSNNDFSRNIKRNRFNDDDDDDEDDRNRRRHIPNDEKPVNAWYHDPANMAVACSYGIACALQLASLDIVTFLGIIFAIISFLAALLH